MKIPKAVMRASPEEIKRYAEEKARGIDYEWLDSFPIMDTKRFESDEHSRDCDGCDACCFFAAPLRLNMHEKHEIDWDELSRHYTNDELKKLKRIDSKATFVDIWDKTNLKVNEKWFRVYKSPEGEYIGAFACPYLGGNGCSIYPYRFQICRSYGEGCMRDLKPIMEIRNGKVIKRY